MSDILTSIDNDILTITLNRADDGNASTDHMAVELTQIMNTAHEKARLVVLTGAGDVFCRGRASHGGWLGDGGKGGLQVRSLAADGFLQ